MAEDVVNVDAGYLEKFMTDIFAGLGNRIGRCFDKKSRPISEKKAIIAAAIIRLKIHYEE